MLKSEKFSSACRRATNIEIRSGLHEGRPGRDGKPLQSASRQEVRPKLIEASAPRQLPEVVMSRFAIRTPYFIVVVALIVAVVGGTALVRMPVDMFPNINIPMVVVATFYNGMPPEQIETDITSRFERQFTLPAASNTSNRARCRAQASFAFTSSPAPMRIRPWRRSPI